MRLNRRECLHLAAGAAAATLVSPLGFAEERDMKKDAIERMEFFPVSYPTQGFFKFLKRPDGSYGREAVIVKITSKEGVVGWGQSVPIPTWAYETLEAAMAALEKYYRPLLLGHNPVDIEGAHRIMDKAIAPGFTTGMPITRAGIDIALYDLAGKILDKPIAAMWGKPVGGELTLSWTVATTDLAKVEGIIDEGKQLGYKNFNIKVGPDPDYDVKLAKMVRDAAPAGWLWADANGGYADTETAVDGAKKLADVGVDVLEAPLRPNIISGYRRLKKLGALPILMDEGVISPVELEEFIGLDMIDGMAMKPARCGGLLSNKRQIETVERHGLMWLGSGLTDPDISLAASLILYGAYGLEKPAALNGPQFLDFDVLARPFSIRDGVAQVPTGPGLGIEVDEDKIRELQKRKPISELHS